MIKNRRKIRILVLLTLFAFFWLYSSVFCENTFAKNQIKTISTSNISLVFSKPLDYKLTQGITVTEKYYIYYDVAYDNKGCLHVIDRTTNGEVKKICKDTSGNRLNTHSNNMLYEWGSNQVSISDDGGRLYCLNLEKLTVSKSNSCKKPPMYKLLEKIEDQRVHQDTDIHDKYYVEANVWGANGYIAFFLKDKKSLVQEYKIPPSIITSKCPAGNKQPEIEGLSIDQNSGDVYVSYTCKTSKPRKVFWFKIENKVFSDYIKPKSSGSSESSKPNDKPATEPSGAISDESTEQNPTNTNDNSCIETVFFGNFCNNDNGYGIWKILDLILNILTGMVIALAISGVIWSGIQRITAGSDEQKAAKAKKRLYEITIGLVIYAAMWGLLQLLFPNQLPTEDDFNVITDNVSTEDSGASTDTSTNTNTDTNADINIKPENTKAKEKVIIIIGASQVTRFTNECGANCANIKTYTSSSGTKYTGANTDKPSLTDTLIYIDKPGSKIDYQINNSKGWGEAVKQINGRSKDTEFHIYLPIPGNEIVDYECSNGAISNKAVTNIAKYYSQLASNVNSLVKNGYKNISVNIVSVHPVRSDQVKSSSKKTVSDTNSNACKVGYRSNYKYYLFNKAVQSQVSNGSQNIIKYMPLFDSIMNFSASNKKLTFRTENGWTTSTYQTVEGIHWTPSTSQKYLKAMLNFDQSL